MRQMFGSGSKRDEPLAVTWCFKRNKTLYITFGDYVPPPALLARLRDVFSMSYSR